MSGKSKTLTLFGSSRLRFSDLHRPRRRPGGSQDQQGLHLLDAGIHEAAADAPSRDDYVRRSAKFGVRAEHKHLIVPAHEVARISRLGEMPQ